MRLPLITPADLSLEQRPLYDSMRAGIASHFGAFTVEREDGALMVPWSPWLHEPTIGRAIWDLTLQRHLGLEISRVGKEARQAVDLIYNDHIDPLGSHLRQ